MGALTGTLVLFAACGSGDDGGGGGRPESDAGGEDLEDEMATLLAEHDAIVNQILPRPEVADDPDDPLVAEYLALYEPDSELAASVVDAWKALAAEGRHIEPYDDEHPAVVTRLDGDVEVVSDDEVRFPICSEARQTIYEGDDPVEGTPVLEQTGEVVAVRVDGDWAFRERNVFDDTSTCTTSSTTSTSSTTPSATTEGT